MGDQETAREKIGEVTPGEIPIIDISTLRLQRGDIIIIRHTGDVNEQMAGAVRISIRKALDKARIPFSVPIMVLDQDQELALLRVQRRLGAPRTDAPPAAGAPEPRVAEPQPPTGAESAGDPGA